MTYSMSALHVRDAAELYCWRKDFGWTQTVASQRLGVGLRTYQRIEAGEKAMPRVVALACEALCRRAT